MTLRYTKYALSCCEKADAYDIYTVAKVDSPPPNLPVFFGPKIGLRSNTRSRSRPIAGDARRPPRILNPRPQTALQSLMPTLLAGEAGARLPILDKDWGKVTRMELSAYEYNFRKRCEVHANSQATALHDMPLNSGFTALTQLSAHSPQNGHSCATDAQECPAGLGPKWISG